MKKYLLKGLLVTAALVSGVATANAQWSQLAPVPADAIGNDGAVSFSINNVGYLVAGSGTSMIYAYHPSSNLWTPQDSVPVNAGHSFGMAFVVNNKAYIVCGDTNFVPQSTVWEFDPAATGTQWTQKNDFPGGDRDAGFGFAIGNFGYIGAGFDGSAMHNDIWKYNPTDDSWSQLTASLPTSLIFPSTFVVGDKGYILTGGTEPNGVNEVSGMWCLDGTTGTLTPKANFPGANRQAALAFSGNSSGYLGGGQSNYTTNYNDMWKYDVATNQWSQVSNVPLLGAAWSSTFVIGDNAYAGYGAKFQGAGLTGDLNFYRYDMNAMTGIEETTSDVDVTFYPNPANDFISLSMPENKRFNVEVYSAIGQKVISEEVFNGKTISVAKLPSGLYYANILSENHVAVIRKIQIVR